MVNEVNKLIYNLLLDGHCVVLPDVGALSVAREPAKIIGRVVEAPRYTIVYNRGGNGLSLVDYIANIANISSEQANDIYRRWLLKVSDGKSVNISDIGVVNNNSFVACHELATMLNKHAVSPIKVVTRSHKTGYYIGIITLILCVLSVVILNTYNRADSSDNSSVIDVENINLANCNKSSDNKCVESNNYSTHDDELILDTDVVVENEVGQDILWYESEDVRHYVVVGSYSTEQNAARAKESIESENNRIVCYIFKLGSMYAVAAYGSYELNDCEIFKRDHQNQFSQAWIHTPKRFK